MSKKIPDQINSDEEYNELLGRIVEGARKLRDPLLESDMRDKLMWFYDKMVAVAREYRTRGG